MAVPEVAIIGAAETERIGVLPDMSALELHADATFRALADAGVSPGEVDGLCVPDPGPVDVAAYLGLTPRWIDGTMAGGCSYMMLVRHASAALAAGLCSTVVITHGESGRSLIGTARHPRATNSIAGQFEMPYGGSLPPFTFTVPARRFLQERVMTVEHLAEVVVAQRKWAAGNPRAMRRELVTVADVLASPMIAEPFTRDMCCPVNDGGGAIVLTTVDRARAADLPHQPVYVWGAGEAVETPVVSQMVELTSSHAFRRAGRDAFDAAGVSTRDIDHLMIYDPFAHVPLYGLEDLGFVARGESGGFIADGNTAPGGTLPMNTNGGGLNYVHTGMYGMFAIQEAVRQLRGEAAAQVPDVHLSFVLGVGYSFGSSGALVLANAPRNQNHRNG
jgi:acetyl-CoA acetyltransferase